MLCAHMGRPARHCLHLLTAAAASVLLCGAAPTPAAAPTPPTAERLGYGGDALERMTVPVMIGGQGPYRFVVDTGAERTVISRELAETLSLTPMDLVRLASIVDVKNVPTVLIPQLVFGRRTLLGIQAPVLERENLGAHGMLGVDSLTNQQLVLDFARREMRLSRSVMDSSPWAPGTIVVTARTLAGRMILTDASIEGQRVTVIVDTGSPITIGNPMLRDRLFGGGRIPPNQLLRLTSVTGGEVDVSYTRTRRLRLGEAGIRDLPIAFADLQLFRELGLQDRPAMLVGMDVLQLFSRVSIDFARHRLRLMPPSDATSAPNLGITTDPIDRH
jgi:predicted aspartyl protease